jgi:cyclopropane-fatty-acyl-phospholipid synthase
LVPPCEARLWASIGTGVGSGVARESDLVLIDRPGSGQGDCSPWRRIRFKGANVLERRALERLLRRLRAGRITVRYWNGQRGTYGASGPSVTVAITTPRVVRAALRDVSLAFGEGYTRGDVEIDEAELDDFFWILAQNESLFAPLIPVHRVHRHNLSRRDSQRRNIGHHYDIGNDYYKLFLDPT